MAALSPQTERGGTVTDPATAEEIETPERPRDTTAQRSYVYAGWDTPLNAIMTNTNHGSP